MTVSRPVATLAACMLLTGSFGSLHAFSVFVVPLEASLGASRSVVSSLYSLALVALTLSVLLGHRVYALLRPPWLAASACLVAGAGLWVAAQGGTLVALYVGYSLLFGAANGVGYGFSLQLAAQAMPERKGLAMGAVTAVYAVGAMVFAKVLSTLMEGTHPGPALMFMAGQLVVVAAIVAVVLIWSRASYHAAPRDVTHTPRDGRLLLILWAGYGLGAAAGLMAIAHAAGIVMTAGGRPEQLVLGAMLIGVGNAAGGVAAGRLADLWPPRRLLIALPMLSALTLIALDAAGNAGQAVVALCVLGFAYGALIAVYPAATADYFGTLGAPRAYGRIFTAWGLAGLAAPWLAGWIYDATGGYTMALLLAAAAGLSSAAMAWRLPAVKG